MRVGLGVGLPMPSGVGVARFSPLDLDPVLWLDASDTSTITEVAGAVSQWDDKSGNGNDFTQGTAALQPTTGTRTINSLNVLDFDGSDLLVNSPVTLSGGQVITIFVVAEPDLVHYGRLLHSAPAVAAAYLTTGRMITTAGTNLISGNNAYSANTSYISRFTLNSTSSSIHLNGVSVASGNAGTNVFTGATVMNLGAFDNTTQMFDGMIAEMIVVTDGALTAGQIAATEQYLGIKWGIYSVPDQITDLTAYPDNGSVDLTWTAPANNGLTITDYLVQYSTDGTSWTTVETASTSLTVTGLSNGVEYDFRVAAKNSAGVGTVSSVVSVSPFDVLSLSPVLWLDASDAASITESGGAVSQWDDLSGNGYDFVQATASAQPTTGTRTINGLNVLDFDSNDVIDCSGLNVADPCTVIWVGELDVGTTQVIYDGITAGRLISYFSSSAWRYFQGTVITSTSSDTAAAVRLTQHDQASSLMRVNGVQVASGNPGTGDNTGFRIGAQINDTQGINGSIAEFIVIDGTLTADQIAATEQYLSQKWGITL